MRQPEVIHNECRSVASTTRAHACSVPHQQTERDRDLYRRRQLASAHRTPQVIGQLTSKFLSLPFTYILQNDFLHQLGSSIVHSIIRLIYLLQKLGYLLRTSCFCFSCSSKIPSTGRSPEKPGEASQESGQTSTTTPPC